MAYKRQVPLGAFGFYASPFGGVHRWRSTGAGEHLAASDTSPEGNEARGPIFNYFAFGAACAEVELDVLTGLFEVAKARGIVGQRSSKKDWTGSRVLGILRGRAGTPVLEGRERGTTPQFLVWLTML